MFNYNKKLIFVFLLFSCIFLSMSFISAHNNIIDDDSYISNCDDSIVINTQNKSSFKDLNNEINDDLNKSEIFLNDDYFYQKECDNKIGNFTEGIFINRSVTINGQGHLIDANHSSRIFYINAGNIVLKNIVFKNGCSDITGGAIYCNASNITIINSTFINNRVFNYEGGAAIIYKYDGTIINSTFIDNYVFEIDNTGLNAVAFNIHNESISHTINCEEVYDSVSFDKNYNVTIINSNFSNSPTYPMLLSPPFFVLDNNSLDVDNLSDKNNSSKIVKKIKKHSLKLIAKNKVFNKKTKNKKYFVILKNNKGKAMKNTVITLKIKGKLFKAKTNKNGKAVFKIKKLNKKGIYKATIIFKGDNIYNKVSKKCIITIK